MREWFEEYTGEAFASVIVGIVAVVLAVTCLFHEAHETQLNLARINAGMVECQKQGSSGTVWQRECR